MKKTLIIMVVLAVNIVLITPSFAQFVDPVSTTARYLAWEETKRNSTIPHRGHDYKVPTGTTVKAISNGTVTLANSSVTGFGGDGPGWAILIRHNREDAHKNNKIFYALYGHCAGLNNIRVGDKVKAGQIICEVHDFVVEGDNLAHLHLGIWNHNTPPPTRISGYDSMGYGSKRWFENPITFLKARRPYTGPPPVQPTSTAPFVRDVGPLKVRRGLPMTFAVRGRNLPPSLAFWIDGCSGMKTLSKNPRGFAFTCKPEKGGMVQGVVKDRPGGTLLKSFSVNVRF